MKKWNDTNEAEMQHHLKALASRACMHGHENGRFVAGISISSVARLSVTLSR